MVPPSKVILGVPYYGYDWPTAGPGLGDPATGPAHAAALLAGGGDGRATSTGTRPRRPPGPRTRWDRSGTRRSSTTPRRWRSRRNWPNTYHIAGLGIWALGMEGNAPAMQAALQGSAPIVKGLRPGPVGSAVTTTTTRGAASPTPTPGRGTAYRSRSSPSTRPHWPAPPSSRRRRRSTGFTTNDPARPCLESEPGLPVAALVGLAGRLRGHDRRRPPTARRERGSSPFPPARPAAAPPTTTTTTAAPIRARPRPPRRRRRDDDDAPRGH